MLSTLERLFTTNPTPHVLDMASENPVVRKSHWLERLVAWFSKWLPFKSKNIFFINEIGLKNIQQLAEEALIARGTNAEARRTKWARAKVVLMSASSNTSNDPALTERLTAITTVALQEISLHTFSPTELHLTGDQETIYHSSIDKELEKLNASFTTGTLDPQSMQQFCTCIDHLSQLTKQDPKELMTPYIRQLINTAPALGYDSERQRLSDFRYLAQDFISPRIVETKLRLAQEMFIDCFRRHLSEVSLDNFVQLIAVYDSKKDLLLKDLIEKAQELLPAYRARLALDFISEMSSPSLKGYKHLLEYTPLFNTLSKTLAKGSSPEVLPAGKKIEARKALIEAYRNLEENNRKEAFFTEEELADVRALCEAILPGSSEGVLAK